MEVIHAKSAFIYKKSAIRQLEAMAEKDGIPPYELMQRAGDALFRTIKTYFTNVHRIGIIVGSGNNGGDGLVAASFLHNADYTVTILQIGKYHGIADAKRLVEQQKIPCEAFQASTDLTAYDLLIDGICGIGQNGLLKEEVQKAVDAMNAANVPIMAIDIPTGIDADTGSKLGNPIKAFLTVSFIGIKTGLIEGDGIQYTGDLVVDDLGLSSTLLESVPIEAKATSLATKINYLPKRHVNWHKGLSGHVLIIGGAPGFAGAPKMAALAALRVGAGLVSVLVHEENSASFDNDHPEIMCHHLKNAGDKTFSDLIAKANAIVIGPGLSTTSWGKALFEAVLPLSLPLLLDADALNLLAETKNVRKENWILTPHPGEAARLLHQSSSDIQKARLLSVQALVKQYGGIAVLKGARTCISDGTATEVSLLGNPGMSTAGLGDILSGVIGGLLAQGLSPFKAATLGVDLHAKAGDLAAKTGMRGMIATDLLPYIRSLVNENTH